MSEPRDMTVRQTLQKHAAAVAVAVVVLLLASFVVIHAETKHPDYSRAGKEFYSDDDGKTWFLDARTNDSPFDHDGRQAYRALVYRCSQGGPFVGFPGKYSTQQRTEQAAYVATLPPGVSMPPPTILGELKKPGDSNWVANPTLNSGAPPKVRCPDGQNGFATPVSPADPDSGATN